MNRPGWPAAAVLLWLGGLGAGCASYSSVRFAPPIQDVELRDAGTEARLAIAWRGVAEHHDVPELCFRIRFESLGSSTFSLAAEDFELLDGALEPFGPARAEGLPARVEPGGTVTFELAFPPAAGRDLEDHDLTALGLRGRFAEGRWSSSTSFERIVYRAYPEPYPPWGFHVGVFWCD